MFVGGSRYTTPAWFLYRLPATPSPEIRASRDRAEYHAEPIAERSSRQVFAALSCPSRAPCARSIVRTPGGQVPDKSNSRGLPLVRKRHASMNPLIQRYIAGWRNSSDRKAYQEALPTLPIWRTLSAKFHLFEFQVFVIWRTLSAKLREHHIQVTPGYYFADMMQLKSPSCT